MKSNTTEQLKTTLAETYTLYMQTQSLHWNAKGKNFYGLHKLLEKQYKEQAEAIDEIAEVIRTYDETAPGTFKELEKQSELKQIQFENKDSMLDHLISLQKNLIAHLKKLAATASKEDDFVAEDIAVERLRTHKLQLWMLKSTIN